MDRDKLLQRLRDFDRAVELEYPDCLFELVIAGGGAMVLLGVLSRPTDDVDALIFPSELLPLMRRFDLNGTVTAYVHNFPYDFEDRLAPVEFPFASLRCFTVGLEDIVVSKLYSNRPPDAVDIRQPEVLGVLDWDQLARAVEEARLSAMNDDRYYELVTAYESYRDECKP